MSGQVSRRAMRQLRLRLSCGLALTAVVLSAATGWLLVSLLERDLERGIDERLERGATVMERALERRGRRLSEKMDRLVADLRGVDGELSERLLSGAEVPAGASRLMRRAGLDELTLADASGLVLSSGHWPERAGLRDPSLKGCPADRPLLRHTRTAQGPRLAIVLRRVLDVEDRRLQIVGGFGLGADWVGEIAEGRSAVLFDLGGAAAAPVVAGQPSGPDLAAAAEMARRLPAAASRAVLPGGSDGASWSVERHDLHDPGGRLVGVLLVGESREPLERTVRRARVALLALSALAALAAALAGLWIASRVARPVGRLIRAVDAIAAGEADYTFPRGRQDELEELEEAFSRLKRSLEFQRQRSLAAERVAAWREVARHVAHEVKNPLVPIRLTVENLVRARAKDPALFDELFEEGAETILEEVDQLSRLVGEFSEFARLPAPTLRRVDLNRLIDGVLELYSAEPGLELSRRLETPAPVLELDPEQISRALKNLVGNAVEAMRERGGAAERRLELATAIEHEAVRIEICDSGPGIPPEAEGRLFEPYFTTREKGTGLGMAIASRIVAEHGGLIGAGNRAGGGARIVIRLPLEPDETRASGARAAGGPVGTAEEGRR